MCSVFKARCLGTKDYCTRPFRNTWSKTNCPFSAVMRRAQTELSSFRQELINDANYNHGAHPQGRQLANAERKLVLALSAAGIHPRQIMASLSQTNYKFHAAPRDVWSVWHKARMKTFTGRTPLGDLLDYLQSSPATYHIHQGDDTSLKHLFIILLPAREICNLLNRGKVWVLDAACKTNRVLLHVVNITAT